MFGSFLMSTDDDDDDDDNVWEWGEPVGLVTS